MSRFVHHIQPTNSEQYSVPMTRSGSRGRQDDPGYVGFATTSADAKFIRERLAEEPWRFLTSAEFLNKPATVVDKLRKAYSRFIMYNRDSMKNGVRRIGLYYLFRCVQKNLGIR